MSRQGTLLQGVIALSLWLSSPVRAAEAEGDERAVELEEIEVRLPRPEPAAGPTAAATVVEAERYAGEAKSVGELLGTAPGVAVQQYGGLGKLATASIRGSSSDQVVVLLDGMPLNTAAGGGVDLSSIPPHWIERIEVIRGASGAHYGAGALGGAVNIVTKSAVAGSWSAQATGGSFYTFSGAADGATGGDHWAVLGAVSADATEGRYPYLFRSELNNPNGTVVEQLRENNGSFLAGALFKGWTAARSSRIDALLQLSGGHRELPGVPNNRLTPDDYQDDARVAGRVRYALSLAEGLVLTTELSGLFDWLDAKLVYLSGRIASQFGEQGAAQVGISWTQGWSTLKLGASAGGEWLDGSGTGFHSRGVLAATASEDASFAGGRLMVSPALRLERLGPFEGISGKLGTAWKLGGPLSLRASAGRTFRAPSFGELYLQQGIIAPNPNLRPEASWSGDAALVADGPLGLASAGAFVTLYQDLIVYEPTFNRQLMPQNDDKAVVRGIELELATAPMAALLGANVALAYTFMETETLRGDVREVGKELPRRPRHRLFVRLGFDQGPFRVHLEGQYVAAQYGGKQNNPSELIPSAFVLGSGVSLRVSRQPSVRIHVEAKNLLDDRTLQDPFANPLPGRMVLVTLRAGSRPEE